MKERRVDGTTMMMGRLTLYGKDGGRKESMSGVPGAVMDAMVKEA